MTKTQFIDAILAKLAVGAGSPAKDPTKLPKIALDWVNALANLGQPNGFKWEDWVPDRAWWTNNETFICQWENLFPEHLIIYNAQGGYYQKIRKVEWTELFKFPLMR